MVHANTASSRSLLRSRFRFNAVACRRKHWPAQTPAGVPVFTSTRQKSSIGFDVKASSPDEPVPFDKWDATFDLYVPQVSRLAFWSIKAQAKKINTGSGMKDGKLKSKDFFDAEHDPYIVPSNQRLFRPVQTPLHIPGTFTRFCGVSLTRQELELNIVSGGPATGQAE